MKFSKDKKPTGPGLHWAKDTRDDEAAATVVDVMEYRSPHQLICFWHGNEQEFFPDDETVIWGDRIETPTVEQE